MSVSSQSHAHGVHIVLQSGRGGERPGPGDGADDGNMSRNSCEACAAAKLKCSKTKPSCGRCTKKDLCCKYFIPKRAGRKPRSHGLSHGSSGDNSSGLENQRPGGRGSMSSDHDSGPPVLPDPGPDGMPPAVLQGLTTELQDMWDSLNGQSHDAMQWDPIFAGDDLSGTLSDMDTTADTMIANQPLFSASDSNSLLSSDYNSFNAMSDFDNDNLPSSSNTSWTTFSDLIAAPASKTNVLPAPVAQMTPATPQMSLASPTSSRMSTQVSSYFPTVCTCMSDALGTMAQLELLAPAVRSFSNSEMPASDVVSTVKTIINVLEKNKEAVAVLDITMRCECQHNDYLLAVAFLICLKVLGFYSALTRVNSRQLASSAVRGHQASLGNVGAMLSSANQLGVPFANVVLNELTGFRPIITALQRKVHAHNSKHKADGQISDEKIECWDPTTPGPRPITIFEQLRNSVNLKLKNLSLSIIDQLTLGQRDL